MHAMKLFLTWLLGVPLLVTSMVMAQSLLQDHSVETRSHSGSQPCSVQGDPHNVATLIAKQGYRIACDQLTIQ